MRSHLDSALTHRESSPTDFLRGSPQLSRLLSSLRTDFRAAALVALASVGLSGCAALKRSGEDRPDRSRSHRMTQDAVLQKYGWTSSPALGGGPSGVGDVFSPGEGKSVTIELEDCFDREPSTRDLPNVSMESDLSAGVTVPLEGLEEVVDLDASLDYERWVKFVNPRYLVVPVLQGDLKDDCRDRLTQRVTATDMAGMQVVTEVLMAEISQQRFFEVTANGDLVAVDSDLGGSIDRLVDSEGDEVLVGYRYQPLSRFIYDEE